MKKLIFLALLSPVFAFASNSAIQCKSRGSVSGELVVTISSDSSLLNPVSTVTVSSKSLNDNSIGGNRLFTTAASRQVSEDPNILKLYLVAGEDGSPFTTEAELTIALNTLIQDPLTVGPAGTGLIHVVVNPGRLLPFYQLTECVGSL